MTQNRQEIYCLPKISVIFIFALKRLFILVLNYPYIDILRYREWQAMEKLPELENILVAIADRKSLDIFCSIAEGIGESDKLKCERTI